MTFEDSISRKIYRTAHIRVNEQKIRSFDELQIRMRVNAYWEGTCAFYRARVAELGKMINSLYVCFLNLLSKQ